MVIEHDISKLSQGEPFFKGIFLPGCCYVPAKARKLARPRLLWVNCDLLREKGIPVPLKMTPEFEKRVLDAFAYAIPQATDPAEMFLAEEKLFFADRYGGEGLEGNWGSGRAASAGRIQIKGIGKTPLVAVDAKEHHAHGGVSIAEAVAEAVWGEINHQELPYGGCRVIAIIDSGTFTLWGDGGKEPRALIIREDVLRPAHFISKGAAAGDCLQAHAHHQEAEKLRVCEAIRYLEKSLPVSQNVAPSLQAGLREFARRLGEQTAVAYARGFYHGTTSPSNRRIDGGLLDYGTQTYQHSFGKIVVLEEVAPAGPDFEEIKETNDNLIDALAAASYTDLPTKAELAEISTTAYNKTLTLEMLCLTGVPAEIVDKLSSDEAGKNLFRLLFEAAQQGAVRTNVDKQMPEKLTRYPIRRILVSLAEAWEQGLPLASVLRPEETELGPLLIAYDEFLKAAEAEVLPVGIPGKAFRTYVVENARRRNRVLSDLFRSNLQQSTYNLVENYRKSGDVHLLWESISQRIQKNRVVYRGSSCQEVILAELRDIFANSTIRYIFNASRNSQLIRLHAAIVNDEVSIHGQIVPLEQAERSRFILRSVSGTDVVATATAVKRGSLLEFEVSLPVSSSELELVLLSPSEQDVLRLDLKVFFSLVGIDRLPSCRARPYARDSQLTQPGLALAALDFPAYPLSSTR